MLMLAGLSDDCFSFIVCRKDGVGQSKWSLAVGKTKKSRRERGYRSWQEMGVSVCAAKLLLLDVHYGGVWENVG
jgi:hypothetical protein